VAEKDGEMTISIMDKLEKLFRERGFKVVRGSKSIGISTKPGWFSRKETNTILEVADMYGATIKFFGHYLIFKKGSSPGQVSAMNHQKKRLENR
jgi:hypothetical protein